MDKPAAGKSQGECAKADLRSRSQVGRPPSMARPSTTSPTLIVSSLSAYATAADSLPCTRCTASSPVAPGAYMVRAQVGTGAPPAEVNTAVKAFADFYDSYHDEWDDSRAGCRAASGVDKPLVRTPQRGATVVRLSFVSSYRG